MRRGPSKPREPRGFNDGKNAKRLNSGGAIEYLRQAGLDWLRGRQRDLLGERRELFGLLGHRLKLMLGMIG